VSIEAIQRIIDDRSIKGTTKLVAMVLAHHAHKDGTSAYPKIATIAAEAGDMHEATVKRELKKLERLGVIHRDGRAPGRFPQHAPIRWSIVMSDSAPALPLDSAPALPLEGSSARGRGSAREPLEVAPANPRTVSEQSTNSESEQGCAPHSLPSDFSLTDEMREWARGNRSDIDVDKATKKFTRHHRAKGTQAVDFRPLWETWIENENPDRSVALANSVRNLAGNLGPPIDLADWEPAKCKGCDEPLNADDAFGGFHEICLLEANAVQA